MADSCPSLIKACRIRLVRLDSCGVPVVGAKSVVVSKGFISVAAAADIEDGEEFLVKNACGEICINEVDCSFLKRYNLTTTLCNVDPYLIEFGTGQRVQLDGTGNAVGFAISEEFNCDSGYSMELWQKIAGQNCSAGDQEWFYWAWPWIKPGTLGDLTFENGPFQLEVNSSTKKIAAADQWGAGNMGPYATLLAGQALLPGEHVTGLITTTQPPDAVCGATAYAVPV